MSKQLATPLNKIVGALSSPQPQAAQKAPALDPRKRRGGRKGRKAKVASAASKAAAAVPQAKKPTIPDSKAILLKIDAGLMVPAQYGVPLSFYDLLNVVEAIIGNYAMNTGIFVNDNNTNAPATNPSTLALYCIGLVMTWIDLHGNLGGANKNDVCPAPRELAVPAPLAKFMEYLAPCHEDGALLQTTFLLDYAIQSTNTSFPDPGLYPGNLPNTFPKYQWLSQYLKPDYNEYSGFQTNIALTLPVLWAGQARQISQELKQASFLTVPFGKISRVAPNASAYTSWVDQFGNQTTLANNSNYGMVACNMFRKYNPEEALVFAGQATRAAPLNPVTRPVPRISPVPVIAGDATSQSPTPWWMAAAYTFVYVGCRQPSYTPGPILSPKGKGYTMQGKALTSLSVSYQQVNSNSVTQMIYSSLRTTLEMTDKPWTNAEYETLRALYLIICWTLVIRRLIAGSCFWNQGNTDVANSSYCPQSFFIDSDWASESVPAVLQKFCDAVGPVIYNGQLILPWMTSPANQYRGGTIITPATPSTFPMGTLKFAIFAGTDVNGTTLSQNLASVPGTQVAPVIRANSKAVNSAFLSGFYNSTDQSNVPVRISNNFFNGSKSQITNSFRGLLRAHCSGPGFEDSYIQVKDKCLGRCSAMLVRVIPGRNATTNELFPTETDGTNYNYSFQHYEANVIAGPVALPKPCTTDATVQCVTFSTNYDSALNQGKYSIQLKSGSSSSGMSATFNQRTFAPDSALSQALQAERARASEHGFINVGQSKLPAAVDVADYATAATERVTATMANTLEVAGGVASLPLYATGQKLVGDALNATTAAIADKLRTWSFVGSEDPYHPGVPFLKRLSSASMRSITNSNLGPYAAKKTPLSLPLIAQ